MGQLKLLNQNIYQCLKKIVEGDRAVQSIAILNHLVNNSLG
ncbi:MAG: hypothetical protein RMY34_07435 [Aulosira sp. DedQUE10]|nr:hypothetical protein [Aulosira sp. DedQUE10]